MSELNYPIKYAVLELKQVGGSSIGYKDYTVGYVVSKCYVIKSSIEYYENGKSKTKHNVIFPYKDFEIFINDFKYNDYNIGNKVEPKENFDTNIINSNIVSELYDEYESASLEASEKNNYLRADEVLKLSVLDEKFNEKLERINDNFLTQMALCHKFEELVISHTDDMKITNNSKVKTIKM